MPEHLPRIVIVGGGFGGLAAAKALRRTPADVVHLEFLGQSSLRASVFVQWVWMYLTGQRGSRVNHHASAHDVPPHSVAQERTNSIEGAAPGVP
jgi:2-polyprenyl-6-methoxyphenol hydroxylase-like FAD-dependent oxidoreductase